MGRFVGWLVAGVLLVGACGGDGGDDRSAVTALSTSTTAAVTTTSEDPTAAVEAAYYAQWDAFVRILADPDPANPLIDQHFTGPAKEKLLASVAEYLRLGRRLQLPESDTNFEPSAVEVRLLDANTADVFECTTDGLVVVGPSGEIIDDAVVPFEARNRLVRSAGIWKVETTVDLEPGEPGCD